MKEKSMLPLLGRATLVTAMVLTGLQLGATPAAHADDPVPPPITVITSPPLVLNSPDPRTEIKIGTDPVGHPIPIIVNPGGTAPIAAECVGLLETIQQLCAGTSTDEPFVISGTPTPLGSLPGDELDWIVDEVVASIADSHGLVSDDLVRGYARPDIRAGVASRMADILNRSLYGEPMTQREIRALPVIEAFFQAKWATAAERSLAEYELWNDSPCSYVPPAPPAGSGLPPAPNPVVNTPMCFNGGLSTGFQIVDNTPPASLFDTWAAYRFPSATTLNATNPVFRGMAGQNAGAWLALGGVGTAAFAGAGIGIGAAAGYAAWGTAQAAYGASTGATSVALGGTIAAVAGPLIIVAIAIIILMAATSQLEEDGKTGDQLRGRVRSIAGSNDILGIQGSQAAYAGLEMLPREDPADPDDLAYIHTDDFTEGLKAQVNEWMSFDDTGALIPDPTVGASAVNPKPDDLTYALGGVDQAFIELKAPPGAQNANGDPVDAYRIKLHRGWMWVAQRRTSNGQYGNYLPRIWQTYLDTDNKMAQVQILRTQEGNAPAQLQFSVTRQGVDPVQSDSWTYLDPAGVSRTVTLTAHQPVLPQVNLLPTVTGALIADHVATFDANMSSPGQSLSGAYTWDVYRVDDDGNVLQTIDVPDDPSTSARLNNPGKYRAEVHFQEDGVGGLERYGLLEFTVVAPAPKILSAQLRDDRLLNGSLFLDLNLYEEVRDDDFTVTVEWANDARGKTISRTYNVVCETDEGSDTPFCNTGTMVAPPSAPTNPQWSESPTFQIPVDQNFLPQVRVTITNRFDESVERVFPITGDHRPSYADTTPSAVMVAGKQSTVDVVQVFPSSLLTAECFEDGVATQFCGKLTVRPYVDEIVSQLPPGVTPQVVQKPDTTWWLQLSGSPQADAIGEHVFWFPFAQEPEGKGLRPPPALASLEIKPSVDEGYRAVLRGTPSLFTDRQYRNVWPEWGVEVNQVIPPGGSFSAFTGTVKCKLVFGPDTIFDKPCTPDEPFPWPDERITGTGMASVYLESASQELADDGPYVVDLGTRFVDPIVEQIAGAPKNHVRFDLRLDDNGLKLPPYTGYTVTCSRDGGPFSACFGNGLLDLPKVPGPHTLDVRAVAPDGATSTSRVNWDGGPPLPTLGATLTAQPAGASARERRFTLSISRGGTLPTPYSGEGYTVTCRQDGGAAKPCFDTGALTLLRTPGRHTLVVTVTGFDGAVLTKTLAWTVETPKTSLGVKAPATAEAGDRIRVKAKKLLPQEKYTVLVGGKKVASGKADDKGKVSVLVKLPASARPGSVVVQVRGATKQRTGTDTVKVLRGRISASYV